MMLAEVSLGAPGWLGVAIVLAVVALVAVVWSYTQSAGAAWVRATCALLKVAGIVMLALCLVEPLVTGQRPRPGSNLFLVAADNSRSLQLADAGQRLSRGQMMKARLDEKTSWLTRLSQDFDVRRYAFDTALHPLNDFANLTLDGNASVLAGAIKGMTERFRGRAVAGMLVFTDGNGTDAIDLLGDLKKLPPIYPVLLGTELESPDLSVTRVTVSQTNFEASPVTLTAEIAGQSAGDRKVVIRVLDETGKAIESRTVSKLPEDEPLIERFLLKPDKAGVSFYTVVANFEGEETLDDKAKSVEATRANNRRIATVDRGKGPYRILYVGGRPNWEFKFLRRALAEDDEVHLVGLVRIARKEPKFKFLDRNAATTNELFRGAQNEGDDTAEQYNEPVLVRLGTENKEELRAGFPKTAEELYAYHAVILDDVESEFFSQDQMSLLQQFVSQRGGGFLMLGGKESFDDGKYQRTPISEFLPVYLDRMQGTPSPEGYRLKLTREGWLQPWVRVRPTEPEEEQRLAGMPAFKTLNQIQAIKPGATVLAHVEAQDGALRPALVVQQFGRGKSAALLVGDLWRWHLRRAEPEESDFNKSWRQTLRWLVSDVPLAVDVESKATSGDGPPGFDVFVRVRDKEFQPLDNATVTVRVHTPDKREVELTAEPTGQLSGEYRTTFIPREPGTYRAHVIANAPDGSEVGRRETGWALEPETDEFRTLKPNRTLLERLAKDTGGEVLTASGLDAFVSSLPNRKIPVVETWTYPLWHQWPLFATALACLVAEWGLRRLRGMP